jgi:hypothetical protein
MTFSTLAQALRAGFQVGDRTEHGYLVSSRTAVGRLFATVDVIPERKAAHAQDGAVIEGAAGPVPSRSVEDHRRKPVARDAAHAGGRSP